MEDDVCLERLVNCNLKIQDGCYYNTLFISTCVYLCNSKSAEYRVWPTFVRVQVASLFVSKYTAQYSGVAALIG